MCWIDKQCIKYIANKDITVFKIMRKAGINKCVSLVKEFEYKYEQLYTLDKEIVVGFIDSLYIIHKGFHSYAIEYKDTLEEYYRYWVRCTIPKGSVYYLNENTKEIVSNQIIIHKPTR